MVSFAGVTLTVGTGPGTGTGAGGGGGEVSGVDDATSFAVSTCACCAALLRLFQKGTFRGGWGESSVEGSLKHIVLYFFTVVCIP